MDVDNVFELFEIVGWMLGVCEDIFEWLVFVGCWMLYDCVWIEFLIFRILLGILDSMVLFWYGVNGGLNFIFLGMLGCGVNEEDVFLYVERFFVNVYIKNFVFNFSDFCWNVRWVLENGFGWDVDFCLMVSLFNFIYLILVLIILVYCMCFVYNFFWFYCRVCDYRFCWWFECCMKFNWYLWLWYSWGIFFGCL